MNLSTAIFLVNPNVRCISAAYEQVKSGTKSIPTEIKSFKTMDAEVKVDDLVIVPTDTRWGFTVAKVTAVDLDVDFDSSQQMRWVYGVVDTKFVEDLIEQEQQVLGQIAAADKAAKQRELKEKLMANNPNLGSIALISMGQVHAKTSFVPEPPRGGAQDTFAKPPRDDYVPPMPGSAADDDFPF